MGGAGPIDAGDDGRDWLTPIARAFFARYGLVPAAEIFVLTK
jgi:hypothetical protein